MRARSVLSICLLALSAVLKSQYASSNFTLVSLTDPETTFNPDGQKYSGCWGWYQPAKNKEYAIACSHRGTYWIDVTNPATPTLCAYRAGRKSGCTWREAKTYRNYVYVISDDVGNNSLQIFDMKYLPDSVHKVYDGQNLFIQGHTLFIEKDKLYVGSVTQAGSLFSSMQVFDLSNPSAPALLRKLEDDYPLIQHVHDMLVRNDTIYASCGYQGLHVYKLMPNNTFSLLGSLTNYPFSGYNHSSAITPDGKTLVFMDEVPSGLPIKVADVSNLSNIQVLATINQFTKTTPHNPFMGNSQYCFASSYQDGLQLFDISAPATPSLAGFFDTHPQSGGNNNTWPTGADYDGQWGSYPYLPSGNIFALDRLNGAFMLSTTLYQAPLVTADFYLPTSVCINTPIETESTSKGANTFTWTFPGGAVSTTTWGAASLSFPAPGVYTIALTAANALYGPSTAIRTITVVNNNISSTVNFTNVSCATCSNGIAQVVLTGGNAPYTLSWTPKGGVTSTAKNLAQGCYTVNIKDAAGCTSATTACISFIEIDETGLNEFSTLQPKLYPNPAQSLFTIELPGSFQFTLYNSLGQVVNSSRDHLQQANISVEGFSKGIYMIEIKSGENKVRKKIVVE